MTNVCDTSVRLCMRSVDTLPCCVCMCNDLSKVGHCDYLPLTAVCRGLRTWFQLYDGDCKGETKTEEN